MKKIDPTPFDVAVVNVVSQLLDNRTQILPRYGKFASKSDVLTACGLSIEKWHEYLNHVRHVAIRPHLQSEIVMKLHRSFSVDPNYIYYYPAVRKIFLEEVFGIQPTDELSMKSAKELLTLAQMQRTQISVLKEKVSELQDQVDSWRTIAKAQEKQMTMMSIAAEPPPTSAPDNPVKNPVNPRPYKPRKGKK
jgi:hypothetical protein